MLFGSLTSIDNWGAIDPRPGENLADILPVCIRAESLLARNSSHPTLKTNFIHLAGAIQMIAGLDYHVQSFARLATGPTRELALHAGVDHEAVAYLNRLGQFYAFARSEFVRAAVPNAMAMIPTVTRLIVFRNKIAAHRSLDAPRGETPGEQVRHAASMTPMAGRLFHPRPGAKPPDKPDANVLSIIDYMNAYRQAGCLAYQIYDHGAAKHLDFCPELDHSLIGEECFLLLQAILH
jgi:hypothetical protein